MPGRKKVLLIGLDGFTWKLGHALMAEGVMPTLARLVREGSSGVLQSTTPAETAPAWTAFQTGCRPGKTGIYSFYNYDRTRPAIDLNNFKSIAVPTIWEIAHHAGKAIVSLNMPLTSPPPAVNGVIIPGFLCPGLSADTVYPPEAWAKYLASRTNYAIFNERTAPTITADIANHITVEQARLHLALELMRDVNWDIFAVQIQSTDVIQHTYWPQMSGEKPGYASQRNDILPFYRYCDDMIAALDQAAGDDALLIVMSDHGFTSLRHRLNLNIWFREHNRLQLARSAYRNQLRQSILNWFPWLRTLKRWGYKLSTHKEQRLDYISKSFCDMIDLERTAAFSLTSNAGLLYLKDDALSDTIRNELLQSFGPNSTLPLMESISDGRSFYGVSHGRGCPDLVVQFNPGVWSRVGLMGDEIHCSVTDNPAIRMGIHDPNGIFLIRGEGVRADYTASASIVDILPTLLAWLGLPIPDHVDGRLMAGIFHHPPECRFEPFMGQERKSHGYNPEEQRQVEKRLSDLGYL